MLSDFPPGELVLSDRPDFKVPKDESERIGMVLGHAPPGTMGNGFAVTQLLVFWTGPLHGHKPFSLEPDHRLKHA